MKLKQKCKIMRKNENGRLNHDWLDSLCIPKIPETLKEEKNKIQIQRTKCNGCYWWWLNISGMWREKKASSNRSRKICANSVFFLHPSNAEMCEGELNFMASRDRPKNDDGSVQRKSIVLWYVFWPRAFYATPSYTHTSFQSKCSKVFLI